MDGTRFDALARALTAVSSRRDHLRRLFAGLLLGLPLALGNDDVEARRCPPCRKKRKGRCKKKRRNGAPCGNGGRCRNGRCDHNVCTLGCPGDLQPQSCGPAGSSCQCVNRGDSVGVCVKSQEGDTCLLETGCEAGQVCGIPCTTYFPSCWEPCV